MYKNRVKMKNVFVAVICFTGIAIFSSCDKEEKNNFHNPEYRTGLWINEDRKDTLEFINSSELIRKGEAYAYEEYLYKIEDKTLIISLPNNEDIETYHSILKVKKNTIVLNNMYPTFGFGDSSGTFVKK